MATNNALLIFETMRVELTFERSNGALGCMELDRLVNKIDKQEPKL